MFRRYENIFRSRWKALWWAAGVCLTAYCTVPSADETAQQDAKAQHKEANPWALHGTSGHNG